MHFFKNVLVAQYRQMRGYEREAYMIGLKHGGVNVGKNLIILNDVIIDESDCWYISIGDDVILSHDVSTKCHLEYTKIGRVNIGDDVIVVASVVGNSLKVIGTVDDFIGEKSDDMKGYPLFDEEYSIRTLVIEKIKEKDRFAYVI